MAAQQQNAQLLDDADVERCFAGCFGTPKPDDMTYDEARGFLKMKDWASSYICVLLSISRGHDSRTWKLKILNLWTSQTHEEAKDFLRAALRELHASDESPFVKAVKTWVDAGRPTLSSMKLFGTWSGRYAALLDRDAMTMARWPDGVSNWCVTDQRRNALGRKTGRQTTGQQTQSPHETVLTYVNKVRSIIERLVPEFRNAYPERLSANTTFKETVDMVALEIYLVKRQPVNYNLHHTSCRCSPKCIFRCSAMAMFLPMSALSVILKYWGVQIPTTPAPSPAPVSAPAPTPVQPPLPHNYSFSEACDVIKMNTPIAHSQRLRDNAEEDDIETGDVVVIRTDPISLQWIDFPVKTYSCTHAQAFEMKVFVEQCIDARRKFQKDAWKCPICNKCALPTMLAKDALFARASQSLPRSDNRMAIASDGSFRSVVDDSKRNGKRKADCEPVELCELDSDDDVEEPRPSNCEGGPGSSNDPIAL